MKTQFTVFSLPHVQARCIGTQQRSPGQPRSSRPEGEITARNLDEGLPRGFLAGAIVKMRVAHRLDWAGELLGRRGEELARDVGSELRCLPINEN